MKGKAEDEDENEDEDEDEDEDEGCRPVPTTYCLPPTVFSSEASIDNLNDAAPGASP